MSHQLLRIGKNVILYHTSTFGQETVKLNGKVIAKSRVNDLPNRFPMQVQAEDGQLINIKLVSRLNKANHLVLDLYKNNQIIEQDVAMSWGEFKNKAKLKGIEKLENYELEEALNCLKEGSEVIPYDAEIYFYKACVHSLQENTEDGIHCLKLAVQYEYEDLENIKTHDKLAYLRMQEAFKTLDI